jgi:hypothetical protein
MARYHREWDIEPVLHVAELWKRRCLLENGSLLLEGRLLWTEPLLDELNQHFVQNPDEGNDSFIEKLERQLKGTSPAACQLMAEMLWALMLFQCNMLPETKRQAVRAAWGWSGEQLAADNPLLSDAVLVGIGSPGTAFNTHRWRELTYFIKLTQAFKLEDRRTREALLSDPWEFSKWMEAIPREGYRQFRHILRYLCFPEHFEPSTNSSDKCAIVAAFTDAPLAELKKLGDEDIDRRLLQVRRALEAERGSSAIDFYADDLKGRWQPKAQSWLFSWNPANWSWESLEQDRLRTASGGTVTHAWRAHAKKMQEGDIAYLVRTGSEPRGVMARGNIVKAGYEAPHYDTAKAESGQTARYVDIEFTTIRMAGRDPIVPTAELQAAAPGQAWSPQGSGIAINPQAAHVLDGLWRKLPPVRSAEPVSKAEKRLQQSETARNLILYGPPGTGKTHRLQSTYIPAYEQKPAEADLASWLQEMLGSLAWWEVVLLVLADLDRPASVADILTHRFLTAKASSGTNQSLRATCWSVLQSHTSPGSKLVKVERRTEPFVFDKQPDGRWILDGDWRESCAELIEQLEKLRSGPDSYDAPIRRYEFVTFHQAYGYEDFIEGIRPVLADGGALTYEVLPGVFRRLCARARQDGDHRYALFIDEINRGNIAKIFGELITLLEPDKRAVYDQDGRCVAGMEVTLPYSGERFGVPANLDVYGTMNTADRSIALLDLALRRRFQFEELMPAPGAITGVSDGLIPDDEGGQIDLRKLLDMVNRRITHLLHRDQTIGHAYLMKVKNLADLRRVLVGEIIPLLQEYFYEDWRRIRQVLGDQEAPKDLQIVREAGVSAFELFGNGAEDLADGTAFAVTAPDDITPDMVRKIYERME